MDRTTEGFELQSAGGVSWLRFSGLGPVAEFTALASCRTGGASTGGFDSLNLGFNVGDEKTKVVENLARLYQAVPIPSSKVAHTCQVHGTRILQIRRGGRHGGSRGADGLVTDRPGIVLFLTFADCVPILAVDPVHLAVGLAHGGWKGTLGGIASKLVKTMARLYDSDPAALRVALGPSIGPCCYVVGAEFARQFTDRWPNVAIGDGQTTRLDLWSCNRQQLIDAGVCADQITGPAICTSCSVNEFFSHRAQRGTAGRFGVFLGATPASESMSFPTVRFVPASRHSELPTRTDFPIAASRED